MAEESTPLRRSSRIRDVSKTPKSRSRSPSKRTRAVSPEKVPKLSKNVETHSDIPLEWGSDTMWKFIYVYWPMILVLGTIAAAVTVPPPEFALKAGRKMGMQEPTAAGAPNCQTSYTDLTHLDSVRQSSTKQWTDTFVWNGIP